MTLPTSTVVASAPRAHRSATAVVCALAVIGALVTLPVAAGLARQTVTVDGASRVVPAAATAGELMAALPVHAPNGDLVGVRGGVARPAGGGGPTLAVAGRPARAGARVYASDLVSTVRGRDVVEALTTLVAATAIPVRTEGKGRKVRLESLGSPGLVWQRRGAVSGQVVEQRTLVPATADVYRRRGLDSTDKLIALTFDDGPWPGQTERILEILKAGDAPSTFFVLGLRVRIRPDLAKRLVDEGHLIADHSFAHAYSKKLTPAAIAADIEKTQQVIAASTGVTTVWYRPPGGVRSGPLMAELGRRGMRMVMWNVDPADWRKPPPDVIIRRVVGQARPGAVVLMHDGGGDRSSTIAALPVIIEQLRAQGYMFVRVDELPSVPTELGR